MLAGPEFDLLVNLTDMQEHYHLNKQALEAGLNVWSEKPMGTTYAQASELLDLATKKGVLKLSVVLYFGSGHSSLLDYLMMGTHSTSGMV